MLCLELIQCTGSQPADVSRPPGGRLPLLSVRPAVTFVAYIRWRHPYMVALIRFQLTTHLSIWKGWVGLVGWPVADGLPTIVVTHQLQVEHMTGKVRRPEANVLPLCNANKMILYLAYHYYDIKCRLPKVRKSKIDNLLWLQTSAFHDSCRTIVH